MDELLRVTGLTKRFPLPDGKSLTALSEISFTMEQGEVLALVGESGSGKSTLAMLITALLKADGGKITVCGIDASDLGRRRELYRQVQMVFQDPAGSFDPRQTLGRGIEAPLKSGGMKRKARRERVEELLRLCSLPAEMALRYPHEVSGGECQRAAIARALAVSPSLLICDEATSALDVTVQEEILTLLASLRRSMGLSILLICHDLILAERFADRVIVLYKGEIVEEGKAAEVLLRPKHPYTRLLLDSRL